MIWFDLDNRSDLDNRLDLIWITDMITNKITDRSGSFDTGYGDLDDANSSEGR